MRGSLSCHRNRIRKDLLVFPSPIIRRHGKFSLFVKNAFQISVLHVLVAYVRQWYTPRMPDETNQYYTYLTSLLISLSQTGSPCDITFRNRKPALNVKIDEQLSLALMYGAGGDKLHE